MTERALELMKQLGDELEASGLEHVSMCFMSRKAMEANRCNANDAEAYFNAFQCNSKSEEAEIDFDFSLYKSKEGEWTVV